MPFEIVSTQVRRLNERGAANIYGDSRRIGEVVHVANAQRNGAGTLVWTSVVSISGDYIAGHLTDDNFERVQ